MLSDWRNFTFLMAGPSVDTGGKFTKWSFDAGAEYLFYFYL